ncbi:MAG: M42 family metallopeptidase [Fimbriimonadaceae bacterium]|nr:M42 family metallopeptidase [Fimbriimonadaceae bacterium]QYK57886.1 MAG: M42 family metallopeptidase [Fimbriimonadaceae bacterium]
MPRFEVSTDYLLRFLEDLINSPSPTGDTDWAVSFVQQGLEELGITSVKTGKGALVARIDGLKNDRPRALTAHVDTLGAMVKEIKPNGRLKMTALNGVVWPAVESEGVVVRSRRGTQFRGSVVLANGAAHVNKDSREAKRDQDNLEIRLDERTTTAEETKVLGIEIGDYVAFDPRFERGEAGFVRSRFLDDKACVACLMAALKALKDAGVSPAQRTHALFSVHEEVGHGGMDGLPDDLTEIVVLDMACVGEGQNGDEFHCSICLKDSNGPYSRELSEKLRALADSAGIELRPDTYPHYGSDGGAYWFSGGQAQVALIGPGVDTSHGYERTHVDALRDTAGLIAEYLIEE